MGLADYTLSDKALWQAGRGHERERIIGLLENSLCEIYGEDCTNNPNCVSLKTIIELIEFEEKENTE